MNYAAVNAKVNAMRAKLLTPQDYEVMNRFKSADEIVEWLAQSADNASGFRQAVHGFDTLDEPFSTANSLGSRHFLLTQTTGYLYQTVSKAAASICFFIPDKAMIDFVMTMASTNDYSINYYTSQWRQLSQLDRPNKTALRSILGAEIDLTNILWMYRLKRYHRIRGDLTYGYLVPVRYGLSQAVTMGMAECESPKALLEEIARSPYAADIRITPPFAEWSGTSQHGGASQCGGTSQYGGTSHLHHLTPEQQLTLAIEKRYKAAATQHPDTLAPTLAYLHKKKQEVQAITRILENKLQQKMYK